MKICVSNIKKIENGGNLIAVGSVTVGDAITLNNVKLIAGADGRFIGMPSRRVFTKDGEQKYRDVVHIKAQSNRDQIRDVFDRALESENGYAYDNGEVNPSISVKVHKVDAEESKSNLRAWASVSIDNVIDINNIAIRETNKGTLMVNFPSKKYTDKNTGEVKYAPLVFAHTMEWEKDGEKHAKNYDKLIKGMVVNEYKQQQPSLSERISNADAVKTATKDEKAPARETPEQSK